MSVHILFNKVFKYIFEGKSIFIPLCFWGVTCDILQPELPLFCHKNKNDIDFIQILKTIIQGFYFQEFHTLMRLFFIMISEHMYL